MLGCEHVRQPGHPLQAYERQVDVLSRQASRGQTESEDLDRERHSLLDRLRAAEQVGTYVEQAPGLHVMQWLQSLLTGILKHVAVDNDDGLSFLQA